jgi:hypothetical protein
MTANGIARKGGEIGVGYLQTSMITAAAHQLPSPLPSATTPDSSDDDELGAWIYKNWRARTCGVTQRHLNYDPI